MIKKVYILLTMILVLSCSALSENAETGQDLEIGDTFFFGAYQQDYDRKDESLSLTLEPIEWIVIDKKDDKALLLSKLAIDAYPYHRKKEATTWYHSDIRKYLNNSFMNACFSETEKSAIIKTKVSNKSDANIDWMESIGGLDTEDYLFLLSYREVEDSIPYLKEHKNRITMASVYTDKLGAGDVFSNKVFWWLRSPGVKQDEACYVTATGNIYWTKVSSGYVGVRPALWLDLNADFSKFDYSGYDRAMQAFNDRDYIKAVEEADPLVFSSFGYKDAIHILYESAARIRLIVDEEKDDYESFLKNEVFKFKDEDVNWYELTCDYTDSCYEAAIDCIDIGLYDKAISLLKYRQL